MFLVKRGNRSEKPFYAPLWAGGVAAVLVVAVLVYSYVAGGQTPKVADLNTPAVAADQGGYENYPANSREAFVEDLRFGFVPVMDLMALGDGTIVVADPASSDFPAEPANLSAEEFASFAIPAAIDDQPSGTTLTWEEALEEFSETAVTMVTIRDADVATRVLADVADSGIEESIVVRSDEPDVLAAAGQAGVDALATPADPPQDAAGAQQLADSGATMLEVPAEGYLDGGQATEALTAVQDAGLGVWISGLDSEEGLAQAGDAGALGAITGAPYELRPPST